jgi:hypothetical protein
MPTQELRTRIIDSLNLQGFSVNGHIEPMEFTRENFKKIHEFSKQEQVSLQRNFIEKGFKTVNKYLINGIDIDPSKIELELLQVLPGTEEETIYKWWNLVWWSVPYQRAYGRQMRFLLWDKTHNAPFGIIGLQSPVLKMSVRDNYLQIPKDKLDIWVNMSMQAQRLGAIPPYNQLLGGKMVAMALTSNELRRAYKKKYKDSISLMQQRHIEPELLFITTTSAFGRSSIYNRLKYDGDLVAQSLGYTKGSGTFHISQEIYVEIQRYLLSNGINVSTTFGNGPSRKLKLLDMAFGMLELPNYIYHNIQREFFLFPIAKNLKDVLSKDLKPKYYNRPLKDLSGFWKERWCVPRSTRIEDWKTFDGRIFVENIIKEAINGNT